MRGIPGGERFRQRVYGWASEAGVELPASMAVPGWVIPFVTPTGRDPLRSGASPKSIRGWEHRFGFSLPGTLRAWLATSDGLLAAGGPLIHPLAAIGPMIPFARMAEPVVQPESWFELGNPGRETVCIDLAYQWPGGDCPVFLSGDDELGTQPRVIAASFAGWLMQVLNSGGREYWFDPGFQSMGNPWAEHRVHAPMPPLPDRLKPFAPRALPFLRTGADDRSVAAMLGVTRGDVEALFRHLQHRSNGMVSG